MEPGGISSRGGTMVLLLESSWEPPYQTCYMWRSPSGVSSVFLVVMDDLLRQLVESSQGITIEGLFLRGFAHADDIRTLGSSIDTVENQAKTLLSNMA